MSTESTLPSETLPAVIEQLGSAAGSKRAELERFTRLLLGRLPREDLDAHPSSTWAALALSSHRFFRDRPPDGPAIRVYNPNREEHGWESPHSVIEIVTNDSPFLVDSVSMAIGQHGALIHLIIHPVLLVERDPSGHLLRLLDGGSGQAESLMHFQIDRQTELEDLEALRASIASALADVGASVRDFKAMKQRLLDIAEALSRRPMPHAAEDIAEAAAFLRWVADDHFTFLGARNYHAVVEDGQELLKPVPDSGLGILRDLARSGSARPTAGLAARDANTTLVDPLVITKTNARSTVHHPGYMDYIGILSFDAEGRAIAEERFLGLYTSNAYSYPVLQLPLIRRKVERVLQRSGFSRSGHSGKSLMHVIESLPRDELFQASAEELYDTALGILNLQERQRTRLFVRRDRFGRYFSCLVYVPRDRMSSSIRERIEQTLKRAFQGERLDSSIQVSESVLARLHLVIRPKAGEQPRYEVKELENKIAQIVRNWQDELRDILTQRHGAEKGLKLAHRYGRALPAGYIEEVTPWVAAADVEAAASLKSLDDLKLSLYRPRSAGAASMHFKLFKFGSTIPLSDALPILENLGLRVLSEHPYEMEVPGANIYIQDFEVVSASGLDIDIDALRAPFQEAFEQVWRGKAENDGFNRLLLAALLDTRAVTMLRAYCKYLLQTGLPYSQAYIERALQQQPLLTYLLVELFQARFDPQREPKSKNQAESARKLLATNVEALASEAQRARHQAQLAAVIQARSAERGEQIKVLSAALKALLDDVSSIDEDRILRAYIGVIQATLRTNFYQREDGKPKDYVAFKFESARVPELPKPIPYREIFVYSPRVEGIHLRMGKVARGGLRWSDRREDFRTEVLGLVKAQNVKNTVIVPVGAKGGFYVKRPPSGGDRDAHMAEGVACYRIFLSGLLDLTDNLVAGQVVPPPDVVRHDDDDPYLVVAADKGTATFSDIANAVAAEYGFWLGDAFASGGSKGYDHKKMGITAKGGWESVKRHFRELGRDCQTEPFTCVGIGDMSGDVFGNGMLLSRQIKLVAAFDHRHIFLDPNPDPAVSYAERERLFQLPRSSWADYNFDLISPGGGVWARSAKSIPISPQARAVLGIEAEQLTPSELIRAILLAPVDLLWNGGIGTYIKASTESHAECGDRANNAHRVDGRDLRCKIIGEGGNLGATQRGRIEAALNGVLLNTDFIDNSAGVDTSDHEVNIKILLGEAMQQGLLDGEERDQLLVAMTDEVGEMVIFDNYRQNWAISMMAAQSVARLGAQQHFIRTLEQRGLLDRHLEFLPSDEEFAARRARGIGLTRPELAILLSYDKMVIYDQLLQSDVPEDPYLSKELEQYFPSALRDRFREQMQTHRLKREIIATQVTNSVVNRMGATFVLRMQEDTGESPAEVAKAFTVAREVLKAREWWATIDGLAQTVPNRDQIHVQLKIWGLMRSFTRHLLNLPGTGLNIAAEVGKYAPGVEQLWACLSRVLSREDLERCEKERERLTGLGFDAVFAERISRLDALAAGLDVVEIALDEGIDVARAAKVYFDLGYALHLKWFQDQIEALPVEGRWHANARGVLRDELHQQHRALSIQLIEHAGREDTDGLVANWVANADSALRNTLAMLDEMRAQAQLDYPTASVVIRRLAQLVNIERRAH